MVVRFIFTWWRTTADSFEFPLLGKRVTLPAIGVERSTPDQRTEPLDSYAIKSDVNSVWKISPKNLPLFQ